jgi:suppressor of G2 allele of SKP1
MSEIDAKAPKPMETEASAAIAAVTVEKPRYRHDYYNSAAEVVVTVFTKGVAPRARCGGFRRAAVERLRRGTR